MKNCALETILEYVDHDAIFQALGDMPRKLLWQLPIASCESNDGTVTAFALRIGDGLTVSWLSYSDDDTVGFQAHATVFETPYMMAKHRANDASNS